MNGPAERALMRVDWSATSGAAIALLMLAALAAGVVWLYRRERVSGAGWLRWAACGLRCLCLVVLGAILLQPSVARDLERFLPSRVVVLADRSASMAVPDAAEAVSRHEAARRLLSGEGGLLAALVRTHEVDLIAFDGRAGHVATFARAAEGVPEPPELPSWEPAGEATDLAGALRAALERPGPPGQLAGVVLLSDGRQAEGGDVAEQMARAAERGVPVHAIAIGSEQAPPNVGVTELRSSGFAPKDLPLRMTAIVRAEGYEGRDATLFLRALDPATGEARDVERRTLCLPAGGRELSVDLTHVPPRTGSLRYEARVEPLAGEYRVEDNAAAREVTVAERGLRVLLLAGGPSLEYHFVSSLLDRSAGFEVEARPGPEAGAPPEDLARFEVVVLMDPPPAALAGAWGERLLDAVESDALGLAFVAGPAHTPELLSDGRLAAFAGALPVVPDASRVLALVGGGGFFTRPCAVSLGADGAGHPVTDPQSRPDAAEQWAAMPPLYWALPTEQTKRGAAELLRCNDPASAVDTVLAATHPYGQGRVFYCGTPETWRWRRAGIERYERFWLAGVRHCAAGRVGRPPGPVRITLEKEVYGPGEAVGVRAHVADAALRPPPGEPLRLAVEREGQAAGAVDVAPEPARRGAYGGTVQVEGPGRYELSYAAPDGTTASAHFAVRRAEVEFADLRADPALLRRMVDRTGGRYWLAQEAGELSASLADLSRTVVEPGPLRPLWDTPLLLAVLGGALTAEWLLRKRMGLL